jgi:hypothetical protein
MRGRDREIVRRRWINEHAHVSEIMRHSALSNVVFSDDFSPLDNESAADFVARCEAKLSMSKDWESRYRALQDKLGAEFDAACPPSSEDDKEQET